MVWLDFSERQVSKVGRSLILVAPAGTPAKVTGEPTRQAVAVVVCMVLADRIRSARRGPSRQGMKSYGRSV